MGGQIAFCERRVNEWRNMLYFVQTERFMQCYDAANLDDQKEIDACVMSCNLIQLRRIIQSLAECRLEGFSVTELRKLAAVYKFTGYNLLSKKQLISRIRRHRRYYDANPTDHTTPETLHGSSGSQFQP